MKFPILSDLPVPDVHELEGRDAFEAMVEHFDFTAEATIPMGLDIIPTEADEFAQRLRRAGLVQEINDPWKDAR